MPLIHFNPRGIATPPPHKKRPLCRFFDIQVRAETWQTLVAFKKHGVTATLGPGIHFCFFLSKFPSIGGFLISHLERKRRATCGSLVSVCGLLSSICRGRTPRKKKKKKQKKKTGIPLGVRPPHGFCVTGRTFPSLRFFQWWLKSPRIPSSRLASRTHACQHL